MQLMHGTHVLVTDGRKMLFFRNIGDQDHPQLETLAVAQDANPPDRAQKSDAPGRGFSSSLNGAGRTAYEEPDYHERREASFARRTAGFLRDRAMARELDSLIVVADRHTLGALRKHYGRDVKRHLAGEIAKDLVKHPVAEIERIILGS